MVWILAGVGENRSSFARMPIHVAIRLRHEWAPVCGWDLDVRHPPKTVYEVVSYSFGFVAYPHTGVLAFHKYSCIRIVAEDPVQQR
jgi:hypothetical protein